MRAELAGVLQAALGTAGASASTAVAPLLAGVAVSDAQRAVAASLATGQRAIWLGALALRHSAYAELRLLARELARVTGATFGELLEGANAAGAYLAGCVPHRGHVGAARPSTGLDARRMLSQPLAGYLLLGTEPWADGLEPRAAATLKAARFVGSVTSYVSPLMLECAHVLLPAAAFAESSGTYVNLEGRWQSFAGAARAPGSARPAWKILRVLGNLLDLAGFDYQSSEQVRDELRAAVDAAVPRSYAGGFTPGPAGAVEPLHDVPMYQIDPLLRRAMDLQLTRIGQAPAAEYPP
jgi:NADH-quinone oxidoreductase subunit G